MKKILLAILLFSVCRLSAATFTAITSGSWASATTWGGIIPSANDVAIIPAGITVTYLVDGNSQWNNPSAINIYGIFKHQGTSGNDLHYNNAVFIEVFSGGLFYDATPFSEFYIQNGSSIKVYSGGSWNAANYHPLAINNSGLTNSLSVWPGTSKVNPGPFILSLNNNVFTFTSQALALKLLSFAGKQQGAEIIFNWETANEINSSGFGLEKSLNGTQFYAIGHIGAKGTPSNLYSFVDQTPSAGKHLYRLKIIDKDGSFYYSNIISIDYKGSASFIKVYPVPANSYINFSVTEKGILYIYNSNGQLCQKQFLYKGINRIDISQLIGGVYYYQLNDCKGSFSKSVAK